MPGEAGIGEADKLTRVVLYVGDPQDLGMTGQQVLLDDVNFELAKAAAELDVPFIAEALAAKEHDDVVVEDALQLAEVSSSIGPDRSKPISAPSAASHFRTGIGIGRPVIASEAKQSRAARTTRLPRRHASRNDARNNAVARPLVLVGL